MLDCLLEIRDRHRYPVALQYSAEPFELLRRVEVERVAHDVECCVIDGQRQAVAVKDFSSRRGRAYHSEPVVVSEADIFVSLADLTEIQTPDYNQD